MTTHPEQMPDPAESDDLKTAYAVQLNGIDSHTNELITCTLIIAVPVAFEGNEFEVAIDALQSLGVPSPRLAELIRRAQLSQLARQFGVNLPGMMFEPLPQAYIDVEQAHRAAHVCTDKCTVSLEDLYTAVYGTENFPQPQQPKFKNN